MRAILILVITLAHSFTYARVNCTGVEAQSKIQDYLSCQTQWTKGLCGVAFGHLTASFISESLKGTIRSAIKENETALARHLWDNLRVDALENWEHADLLAQQEYAIQNAIVSNAEDGIERIRYAPYFQFHESLKPQDIIELEKKNPELAQQSENFRIVVV